MENIEINGKTYGYAVNYKNNDDLRNSLNRLTRKIYNFDFEKWYQNGYWKERYIPYSIVDKNNIVSNASVNVIDFWVMGDIRRYIQIGTVMTDEDYRNQGLSKVLIKKILDDWRGNCDLIYLFANDTVLDFYPKFGFNSIQEYRYLKKVASENIKVDLVKLDMSDEQNKELVINKINRSTYFSKISMIDNASLIMFYCTSFMSQNVYYISSLDTIVIAEFIDNRLYIKDIFSENEVSIDEIIIQMINKEIKYVELGFEPKDNEDFEVEELKKDATTLFVLDDKWRVFDNKKIRFPVLSHA